MTQPSYVLPQDLVLTGPTVALRPLRASDVGAVHAAMQDRRMHRFLALPYPYTEADAEGYVTTVGRGTERSLERGIVDTATDSLVGAISLRLPPPGPHHGTAEIGYAVYTSGQGRGRACEAAEVLAQWAFGFGLGRLELSCSVENLPSAKTALNAGFRFEGVARAFLDRPRAGADAALFARVAGDPPGPVARSFPALPEGGLTDGTVRIRELHAEDADPLYEEQADAVTVANGFTGVAPTRDGSAAAAAAGRLDWLVGAAAPVTVLDVASGRYAGSIRLRHAGPPGVGGIGYAVHPAFRGRGVAARALRLLVPWAFGTGNFARLELGAKADNVASQRAARSAGFEPDGVRAARLRYPDGSYADEVRFSLVNPQTARRISP
jgi:RimJ/RimL family protein N-acetyltransferase